MARGIPRSKEEIIETLRPFFQLGASVRKACDYAGVPQSTVLTWVDADDDLRAKITGWQSEINVIARKNWREKIEMGDYQSSKEWLERREKKEFSTRQEHEVDMPTPVRVVEVTKEHDNPSNTDSTSI